MSKNIIPFIYQDAYDLLLKDKRFFYVVIDGLIGAGKTTLMLKLKDEFEAMIRRCNTKYHVKVIDIPEPEKLWEKPCSELTSDFFMSRLPNDIKVSDSDISPLQLFYRDQKKYAFAFQVLAFSTRAMLIHKHMYEIMKENFEDPYAYTIILGERSVFTDKEIFAGVHTQNGNFNCVDAAAYSMFHSFLCDPLLPFADVSLYLNVPIPECVRRYIIRGREAEVKEIDAVSLAAYEGTLLENYVRKASEDQKRGIKVMNFDWSGDITAEPEQCKLRIYELCKSIFDLTGIVNNKEEKLSTMETDAETLTVAETRKDYDLKGSSTLFLLPNGLTIAFILSIICFLVFVVC